MPAADPLPALHDTADPRPTWSVPGRDDAARDAARRALARAASEHEAEKQASAERGASGRRPPKRWHSLAAACAVVVLGAGTVSVAVRGSSSARETTDPTGHAEDEIAASRAGAAATGVGSPADASDLGEAGAAPGASTDPATHGAVYEGGHVTLRGTVPTRAMADALYAKAAAVVGPANVTDEYVIDPSAPSDVDGRVRIADPVLFPTGSAELDPKYAPLLDAGVVLMTINPAVVLQVVGHTDDVGTEETNRVLSIARAQAVVTYVKAKGAFDDARFVTQGAGESQPIADNATVEGRSANRRIEVTILGLLMPPKS